MVCRPTTPLVLGFILFVCRQGFRVQREGPFSMLRQSSQVLFSVSFGFCLLGKFLLVVVVVASIPGLGLRVQGQGLRLRGYTSNPAKS